MQYINFSKTYTYRLPCINTFCECSPKTHTAHTASHGNYNKNSAVSVLGEPLSKFLIKIRQNIFKMYTCPGRLTHSTTFDLNLSLDTLLWLLRINNLCCTTIAVIVFVNKAIMNFLNFCLVNIWFSRGWGIHHLQIKFSAVYPLDKDYYDVQ